MRVSISLPRASSTNLEELRGPSEEGVRGEYPRGVHATMYEHGSANTFYSLSSMVQHETGRGLHSLQGLRLEGAVPRVPVLDKPVDSIQGDTAVIARRAVAIPRCSRSPGEGVDGNGLFGTKQRNHIRCRVYVRQSAPHGMIVMLGANGCGHHM